MRARALGPSIPGAENVATNATAKNFRTVLIAPRTFTGVWLFLCLSGVHIRFRGH